MKKAVLLLVCLIFAGALAAQSDYQTAMAGGVVMVYRTLADNQTLEFSLTAATSGWIAVGFRSQNQMQGANIIIGYANVSVVSVRDDYGTAPTTHTADTSLGGSTNVTVMGGGDQGGSTMMEFHIPLNSGDTYDPPMQVGQTYNIILAQGNADSFTGMHSDAGLTTVNILSAPVAGDDLLNPALPALELQANSPNPFALSTSLNWKQNTAGNIRLDIFNSRGQLVYHRSIGDARSGDNSYLWNGCDERGNMLASGCYRVRISSNTEQDCRNVLILRR